MKRNMITVLVVIVLFGTLGTLIQRDPGYVLVTYDGYSLQTSLWVGAGLLAALVGLVYFGAKLLRFLLNTSGYLSDWNDRRRENRAVNLSTRGQLYLLAGDHARALKFLEQSAKHHTHPAPTHLYAARAADLAGDAERREANLRLAIETDTESAPAAATVAATLAADREDWPACLTALEDAPENPVTLELRKRALAAAGEVEAMEKALPVLRKKVDASDIELPVAMGKLTSVPVEEARKQFKKLPAPMKSTPDVVLASCDVVGEKEAEAALRAALSSNWDRDMILRYAGIGQQTLSKRLAQVRQWQGSHGDDADLHLLHGMLLEESGDREAARAEYDKSLSLAPSREANERVAGLLSFNGDYTAANDYLKAALRV